MTRFHTLFTFTLATLIITFSLFVSSTSAKERSEDVRDRSSIRADRVASREAKIAARSEQRCSNVYKRIDARINNYNVRKDNHLPIYRAALERWRNLSTRLASEGFDVTKLNTDLNTLETKLNTAADAYQTFINELVGLKELDCQEAKASFLASLSTSQTRLSQFRALAREIHDFVKSTIKADLQALRAQFPTPTPTP